MERKQWNRMRKALTDAGFEVRLARSGHWKVYQDGRYRLTMAGSASDYRTWLNTKAMVRRHLGVQI